MTAFCFVKKLHFTFLDSSFATQILSSNTLAFLSYFKCNYKEYDIKG